VNHWNTDTPIEDKRRLNLDRLRTESFDVLIVGGGINGAGIARDLTMRGAKLNVGLVEKHHFASGTSGKNSQLIHGGLRYLKYLEFDLVHEALRERATLLRIASGLVQPLEFLLPCYHAIDRWFYGAGLALYDLLGAKRSHSLSAEDTLRMEPGLAREGLRAGLIFWDCAVHSARLVVENILDAEARGAAVANYVEWDGEMATDRLTGDRFAIRARKIVDATGAWNQSAGLRLVRGSHLIFPRIQAGSEAISYFDEHGRIVFLIPWGANNDLTLVGTTDVDHHGTAEDVKISAEETEYLQSIVRRLYPQYGSEPVASYSALRPLIAESGRSATSTSREHRIWETHDGVLHIAGGKYTTYRAMSEELVDSVLPDLRPGRTFPCQTAEVPLSVMLEVDIRIAVEREFARRLSDYLFVSTYRGYEQPLTREYLEPLARQMGALLGWSEEAINRAVEEP
jgi:glycerol-3-phosphate dehydrogenase